MEIGDRIAFVPSVFLLEVSGSDPGTGRRYPRRVTGTIVYINQVHRYYTVAYEVHGHVLRESFKF